MDRDDWIAERDDGPKKLARSEDDRMIAGVCAGIAEYIGWPANRVRFIYALLSVFSAAFPGILVYIVLWLLMPSEGKPRSFRLH
jgi:phage shock protein PspC (stress-responsive transcriptional regulator)